MIQRILGLSLAMKAAITVMLSILLIAGMLTAGYFLIIRASDAAASARAVAIAVQANQRELCRVTNQENAKQILLWEYILHLTPPKTPEQQKLGQQFSAFLNQVFKSLPCPAGD